MLREAAQEPGGSMGERPDDGTGTVNALTIDVEDYFQVSAMARYIDRGSWDRVECRVEANVERILALLSERGVSATFFTLGWVAERYPSLVRRIAEQGHEVASHGYGHHRVTELSAAQFREDVIRARRILEDACGCRVLGYRAPSFSIGRTSLWALDVLMEAGYRYSSSIYPIHHDHYGMPEAPRFAHRLTNGLLEIPMTTLRLAGRNLPSSGGGYFRLLPYAASRWMISQVNRRDHRSAVFYFHPWEIDPDQPRIDGIDLKTRFRHYLNLDRTEARLGRLLRDFQWSRMDRIFIAECVSALTS